MSPDDVMPQDVAAQGPPPDAVGPPPEAMMQKASEPFGASLLRRVHEDAAMLLMEYDEQMGQLDNPDVRNHMTEILKTLEKLMLGGTEKVFKKQYKQLPPLDGMQDPNTVSEGEVTEEDDETEEVEEVFEQEASEEENPKRLPEKGISVSGKSLKSAPRKTMDTIGDNPIGADSRNRPGDDPESGTEGAVIGMQIKKTRTKSLLDITPQGKGFGVVEYKDGKALRSAVMTPAQVSKYLSELRVQKSLKLSMAKSLNAGKPVRLGVKMSLVCPGCKCAPCGCGKKTLYELSEYGGKKYLKPVQVKMGTNEEAKSMPGSEEWAAEEASEPIHQDANVVGADFWSSLFEQHEIDKLSEAVAFLTEITDDSFNSWSDEHRYKSFYFHKCLEPMGMRVHTKAMTRAQGQEIARRRAEERVEKRNADQQSDTGGINITQNDPGGGPLSEEYESEQKNMDPATCYGHCGSASGFFKMLAQEKAYGIPHQTEARKHKDQLESILSVIQPSYNDEDSTDSYNPNDTSLDAIADTVYGEVQEKSATIGSTLDEQAKRLAILSDAIKQLRGPLQTVTH